MKAAQGQFEQAAAQKSNTSDFESAEYEDLKQQYDPVRHWLRDMKLAPDEYSVSYEVDEYGPPGEDEMRQVVRSRQFTNFHDFKNREPAPDGAREEWNVQIVDAEGRLWSKEGSALSAHKKELEELVEIVDEYPDTLPDEYAEAIERGEIKKFEETDPTRGAPRRGDAREVLPPRREDQQREIEKGLRVHAALAGVEHAAAEHQDTEHEKLARNRAAYVREEVIFEQRFKKMRPNARKQMERIITRAVNRGPIRPGDKELFERKEQIGRRDFLREAGSEDEQKMRKDFLERRDNFLRTFFSAEEGEQIYRRELTRSAYDAERAKLMEHVYKEKVKRLTGRGHHEDWVRAQARGDVFQEFVIKEKDIVDRERLALRPEKDRSIMRRLWEGYRSMSTKKKIVLGILAGASVSVAVGTLSVAGLGIYTGRRVMGSAASAGVSWLVERYTSKRFQAELDRLTARENELGGGFDLKDPKKAVEELRELEAAYAKIAETRLGIQKKKAIVRGVAVGVTGVALGAGSSYLMHHLSDGSFLDAFHGNQPAAHDLTPQRGSSVLDTRASPQPGAADNLASHRPPATVTEGGLHREVSPVGRSMHEDLAVVRKGEGAWHAVRRQLETQLHEHPERFKLREGGLGDPEEIRRALDRRTMEILEREGFVDGHGKTLTKFYPPGMKILLQENGRVSVEGGTVESIVHGEGGETMNADLGNEPTPEPISEPTGEQEVSETLPAEAVQKAAMREIAVPELAERLPEKYRGQFDGLSPYGKEYIAHLYDKRVVANAARLKELGTHHLLLDTDFSLAEKLGSLPQAGVETLERYGFPSGMWLDRSHELLAMERMTAEDFLKHFTDERGAVDHALLGKNVNLRVGGEGLAAVVADANYLALAEAVQRYLEEFGGAGGNMKLLHLITSPSFRSVMQ